MFITQHQSADGRSWFVLPARKEDSEHPFVEISDSIYLLSRLAIGLYVIAILIIASLSSNQGGLFIAKLGLKITAFLLMTLPLWLRIKEVGLFHPLYIIAAISFLRGAMSGLSSNTLQYHPAAPDVRGLELETVQIKIVMLKILSLACIYLVFFASRGIKWKFLSFRKKKGVLVFASTCGFIIGVLSLYLLVQASGGLSDHLKNINVGINGKRWVKYVDYVSIFSQLVRLTILPPAAMILAGKKPFSNPLLWPLVVFAIIAAFMTNGRRSSIVLAALVFVACWILRRRSLAIGRLAIVGLLLFLMIGLVGEFRRANWGRQRGVNIESLQRKGVAELFNASAEELASRSSSSPMVPIVAYVPDREPFRYGSIYFSYLYRFVPRSIWKDKPEGGIGHDCAQIFYGRGLGVGVPPGAIGEAYWSFGFMGVAIVFCFWGWCLRSLGNFFERFRSSPFATVIYLATVVILQPSETGFRGWLYLIVPLVGVLFIMGAVRFAGRGGGR